MVSGIQDIEEFINAEAAAIWVQIVDTKGSTPRDPGAWMLVSQKALLNTLGGGELEWRAIEKAQQMILSGLDAAETTTRLGPETGQCCGGQVKLDFKNS